MPTSDSIEIFYETENFGTGQFEQEAQGTALYDYDDLANELKTWGKLAQSYITYMEYTKADQTTEYIIENALNLSKNTFPEKRNSLLYQYINNAAPPIIEDLFEDKSGTKFRN